MRLRLVLQILTVVLAITCGHITLVNALPGGTNSTSPSPKVEIEITGIKGALLKNVKGYLRLIEKIHDPEFNLEWLKFLHKGAKDDIKKALEPFGYFSPRISSRLQKLDDNRWKASYHIDPGPRVIVKEVDIGLLGPGKDDPDLEKAVKDFPLRPGDPLDQASYEAGKRAIIKLALSKGYVEVKPKVRQVLVDPRTNTAVIKLHIDTGPRFRLGEIRVHQDFMDPGLIRRFLKGVKVGEPFTDGVLLRLQQALSDTGYFNLVDVRPLYKEAKADHIVPVDIYLTPSNRHVLSFGLGFDTEVGPKGSFRWHNARVNRHGHTSDLWSKLSTTQNNINFAYWIPASKPQTDRYGIITRLEQEKIADTERNTLDLEAGYYFVWRKWSSKLFLEAKYERFRLEGEPWTRSKVLTTGGKIERSNFAKGPFPQRGWYLYSELRGSPGLISESTYIRHHLRTRILFPVGQRGRLIFRGEMGLAFTSDFSKYPNSLRFFAGGAESIRGYRWKKVGPEDQNGNVKGGRNIAVASLEFNYRVWEKWIGALFVDAGNAFNGSLDRVYVGVGTGVRWITPVGTVKVDFGWPVNEDDRGMKFSDVKFYFGFEITF